VTSSTVLGCPPYTVIENPLTDAILRLEDAANTGLSSLQKQTLQKPLLPKVLISSLYEQLNTGYLIRYIYRV